MLISKSEWGNKFIDNLAQDIKTEFPETTGFSVRNLKYMKKFAKLFVEDEIDEYNFAAITWYHHMALMDKEENKEQYIWYSGIVFDTNLSYSEKNESEMLSVNQICAYGDAKRFVERVNKSKKNWWIERCF